MSAEDTQLAVRYEFSQTDTEVMITIQRLPNHTKAKDVKMDSKAATLRLQIHDEVACGPP